MIVVDCEDCGDFEIESTKTATKFNLSGKNNAEHKWAGRTKLERDYSGQIACESVNRSCQNIKEAWWEIEGEFGVQVLTGS